MNVTSLLTRLSNFVPPSVGTPADEPARPAPANSGAPGDRFGPASRIGLSEQARKLLDHMQTQGQDAPAPEREATVRMHRSVAYPLDIQPSPQQLAQVHKIAARYAHDIRPDATQRMMEELRQEGLHPDQLAREPDDAAPSPARAREAAFGADALRKAAEAAPARALPGGLTPRPGSEAAQMVA